MELPESWKTTFQNVLYNVIQPQLNSTPLGKWRQIGHQGKFAYFTLHPATEAVDDIAALEALKKAPRWQRQLLRGRQFSNTDINKLLQQLEKDDIRIAGDGSVRDQMGSFAFCFASKSKDRPFLTCTGPVDGNRNQMRALRAECTHVLAALSLLQILEPYVSSDDITIPVHTDCKTLVNRLNMKYINRPSLVLGDHMDLIYQIRDLVTRSKFRYQFMFTQAIKEAEFDLKTPDEKLVQQMHVRAYGYYLEKGFTKPRSFSDYMPGSEISIIANNRPIVSDIGMSIQGLERQKLREDYFSHRMKIHKTTINKLDTYTLGRVLMKTPHRRAIYSKIINRELNTMVVNEKWSGASNKCPVCLHTRENSMHHLQCQSQDMRRAKDSFLSDFDMDLISFKTYPPLQEFIIEFFEKLHSGQALECPDTVDQLYMVELQMAYEEQNDIGWENFARGLLSKRWRHLQHCYLIQNENKDMFAVDKWTRMVIKNILEYNRVLWKERCDILHKESDCTYQDRQRQEIYSLCQYLRKRKHLLPVNDHHFLDKDASFFFRRTIDNVLNWEKRIIIGLSSQTQEKKTRDIRSYMVETSTHTTPINPPESIERTKRKECKTKLQTDLDSFILRQHQLQNKNIHSSGAGKKQKVEHTAQQLLQPFTLTSKQNASLPYPPPPATNAKRVNPVSHDDVTRFKRHRSVPPLPTSDVRSQKIVQQARFGKRRKITNTENTPFCTYRT